MRPLALYIGVLALAGCGGEPEQPPNLLLVTVDSLRVDRLRLWNPNTGVATPELEKMARAGTRFSNTWAVAPWTAPSVVSVFSGLFPPSHGVVYRDDSTPEGLPTLPRLLEGQGYHLGNFSFFAGISYFRNLGLPAPPPGLRHGRVVETFSSWLSEVPAEEPFFAWLHLLEPHLPYGASGYTARKAKVEGSSGLVEAQLRGTLPLDSAEFAAGDRDRLIDLYDQDVVAMDEELGKIFSTLEVSGRSEETLVVFVADHGEELLEDGWVGHASTAVEAKLLPEILRIPFVLSGPNVPAGRTVDALLQQVDIFPSILRLLNIDLPKRIDGRLVPGLFALRGSKRRFAFFDSSMGGNLTPIERRGERLQAITDGECLLQSHIEQGAPPSLLSRDLTVAGCSEPRLRRLAASLDDWREEQTLQRVQLLADSGSENRPDGALVAAFDQSLEVLQPPSGTTLDWSATQGQLVLEWSGTSDGYWVEYQIAEGLKHVEGSFPAEQQSLVFGPFPLGFWNDLASYSPFLFRVVDTNARTRSAWIDFKLEPAS